MRPRRRRAEHGERGGHERWLVSYADFITLLFAFFTVLFATSERNLEKTQEFQESLKRYLIKAGSFGGSGGQINQGEKNNQVIESPLPTYKSSRPQDVEVTEVTEQQVEQALTQKDREDYLIDVFSDDLGVRIVVRGEEIFPPGESKFKQNALPFLNRLAEMFKKIDRRLLIEGHVDHRFNNADLRGVNLTQSRTLQIARYFSKAHQLPSDKMATLSFGSSRPLSSNKGSLNDRIEFVVLFDDSPI